jgi:hypothetical protein
MTFARTALTAVLLVTGPTAAAAQSTQISGTVLDARTGTPLSGVAITVEGQSIALVTDPEGRFRIDVPPGEYVLLVSYVGYAFLRQPVDARNGSPSLTMRLSEGAGTFEEHVTVSGADTTEVAETAGATLLHGRELQALRGVTLDDPLRAMHSVPSVSATDDFYSEFAVRGNAFRHVGLNVDGLPSRYMMHSVFGVTDGGSISMINSDTIGSMSLVTGSYPQHVGRRIGAQMDVEMREGDRGRRRFRVGLSGTSATFLAEGPMNGGRASWLVSARRSYLDLLLERIEDGSGIAFGFTDVEGKLVFDLTPKNQLQFFAIAGGSTFTEDPEDLGVNDEAEARGGSWLSALGWRFTPSAKFVVTQHLYTTGLGYRNRNTSGGVLDDNRSAELAWRADANWLLRPGFNLEFGGDAQRLTGMHDRSRALNTQTDLTLLNTYDRRSHAASAYVQAGLQLASRLNVAPGVRFDQWGPTSSATASPWLSVSLTVTPRTLARGGAGVYRQFADFEQTSGLQGGGDRLRPERARHVDVGLVQRLPHNLTLSATGYARDEFDVLWTPDGEPRQLANGSFRLGRADAPWTNVLDGRARGIELVLRRDSPTALSGWAGYAYGRHEYTQTATGERFWSDFDQRHALSVFGQYRLSSRSTIGAKFRYGSNYPLVGYIGEATIAQGAPPLFGGTQPLFYSLTTARNTLRLPAYARLDIRADRTFFWSGRRMTLFVEVANAFNRRNLRNEQYGVDRNGRVFEPTGSLLPIVPSAGFVIEF